MKISKIINKLKLRKLKKKGLSVGSNFTMENRVRIDNGFPWLIKIGDNVTLAPDVMILSHDACTKKILGIGSIGKVVIGNNVFVGAKSIILANTKIGNNVIIGAGSVVTKDIPDNCIACGNPAKVINTMTDFKDKKIKEYKKGKRIEKTAINAAKRNKEKQKELEEYISNDKAYIGNINENKK